ncbi:MAG: hypothetical protein KKF50_02255 [Nanoarchaeota archaeon]|nr:hypothetical protein [Nanoarchaeota archaeon]
MNKKQLYILAWGFMLIGTMFIYIDTSAGVHLTNSLSSERPFDISDAYYVMNAEMYDPFIWTFFSLWVLFMILAWQTKEKK